MPKYQTLQTRFISGELSPLLDAHIDLDRYESGARLMENVYAQPHGVATARPGTHYVDEIRNSAVEGFLAPYVFSDSLAYMLVFNDGYIQFIKDKAFVETSPGVRYEIAHTYTDDELTEITYAQQGTVMFLCHQNHPPRKLTRITENNWVLEDIDFNYYAATNTDFESAYVNFKIIGGTNDFDTTTKFTFTTDGSGNVTAGPTRTGAPSSLPGTMSTPTVSAALDVAGTWTVRCVSSVGAGATADQKWSVTRNADGLQPKGKWSPLNYPSAVSFFQQRLFLGGTDTDPHRLWASKTGNPFDLSWGITDEDGFTATISAGESNKIRHLVSTRQLIILTQSDEFSLTGSRTAGLSASTVTISSNTSYGANEAKPVKVASEVLFTERSGLKMRAMAYDAIQETNTSPNVTIISEHITESGIRDVAYQSIPDQIVWAVRNDGGLLSLTHLREQEITAWTRHNTGTADKFERVGIVPSGNNDYAYFIVKRTVNGSDVRYIEYLDYDTEVNGIKKATTDCCLVKTGSQQTTWTGFDHIEGATVDVVADDKVHPQLTVTAGAIELQYPADTVQVGLPFEPKIGLLRPEPLSDNGVTTRLGASKIHEVMFHFNNTVNAEFEYRDQNDNLVRREEIPFARFGDPTDRPIPPFSGAKKLESTSWDPEIKLNLIQSSPMPFTLKRVDVAVIYNE